MRAAFDLLGAQPPGLELRCDNLIPHGRGLGSSSAAIVAGVSLARALVRGGSLVIDDEALFRLAAEIEGHPDNVAPAFYGGFVISGMRGRRILRGQDQRRPAGVGRGVRAAHAGRDDGGPSAAPGRRRARRRRCQLGSYGACWSPPSRASPNSSCARLGTTCTRTIGSRRCRPRLRSCVSFALTASRPSSLGPGQRCSRSPTAHGVSPVAERPGAAGAVPGRVGREVPCGGERGRAAWLRPGAAPFGAECHKSLAGC